MKILLEIIKILLPAAVTGIFTFWATKYAYSKDVPLQKMEIAYNRIYYPLYNLLQNIKYKNLLKKKRSNYTPKFLTILRNIINTQIEQLYDYLKYYVSKIQMNYLKIFVIIYMTDVPF